MQPMLAKTYEGQDPTGWMMSEKLDGVRAIWTGFDLITRNGKPIHAPQWFLDQLPLGICLDGELTCGRGLFQRTVSIVRKIKPTEEWHDIIYMVFDAPDSTNRFYDRLQRVCSMFVDLPNVWPHRHEMCFSINHLHMTYKRIIDDGGEGLMLRNPASLYEAKRSNNLLKYKPLETDEAVVVGHYPGEGKHTGRLGALACVWRGVHFSIGTGLSDYERENPPALGARVTFSYQCLTDDGVPRFPVFITERNYE